VPCLILFVIAMVWADVQIYIQSLQGFFDKARGRIILTALVWSGTIVLSNADVSLPSMLFQSWTNLLPLV